MIDILKEFLKGIKKEIKKPTYYSIIVLAVLFSVISFFDKTLAVGLLLLLFLSVSTIFIINKTGIKDKEAYAIFLIALTIHLAAVAVIYYGGFRPFGGGLDSESYNKIAIELADRFSRGNFSLAGLYTDHFFPILVGILYMVTLPNMIVGQLFTVWLAAVSILLAYLMVLQIGGTKKIAFLVGLVATFYPSYLYFGSILLKDTVVIPLLLAGMLLSIKMLKNFSWVKFLIFFVILTALINLRFYVGYALMFSFIICWLAISSFKTKEKIIYGATIIFLLGFSPHMVGNGYYASNSFKDLLNPKSITYYREVVYSNTPSDTKPSPPPQNTPEPSIPPPSATKPSPPPQNIPEPSIPSPSATKPSITQPSITQPSITQPSMPQPKPLQQEANGNGSTFVLETGFDEGFVEFSKNSFQSFLYSLLGPFPWQLRYQRQMMGLIETIPWYLLIVVSIFVAIKFIRRKGILEFLKFYKFTLPLLIFSVLALEALSLFINNYGIIARIRIPMFICLVSVVCIIFNEGLEKYYAPLEVFLRKMKVFLRLNNSE